MVPRNNSGAHRAGHGAFKAASAMTAPIPQVPSWLYVTAANAAAQLNASHSAMPRRMNRNCRKPKPNTGRYMKTRRLSAIPVHAARHGAVGSVKQGGGIRGRHIQP